MKLTFDISNIDYLILKNPESNQLRSSQQEHFQNSLKLHPLESVFDPLGAIKRNERLSI